MEGRRRKKCGVRMRLRMREKVEDVEKSEGSCGGEKGRRRR